MNIKIYKNGQGKNARLGTAISVFVVAALGCWILHRRLLMTDNPWIHSMIPAALCAVFAAVIYWLSNIPAVADFLIAAEGEIKKVSWSSRKEIAHSTVIVIFVVAVMAIGLGLVDLGFQVFFRDIVNLY
ncbi:MAG: preprotein translocase subunit SecE [Planctomycetaceae bacterium]|nr:preprotein translocase subunit SecE [Planctomycetaceae bacterium]